MIFRSVVSHYKHTTFRASTHITSTRRFGALTHITSTRSFGASSHITSTRRFGASTYITSTRRFGAPTHIASTRRFGDSICFRSQEERESARTYPERQNKTTDGLRLSNYNGPNRLGSSHSFSTSRQREIPPPKYCAGFRLGQYECIS
jgi:hypothetical protein